MNGFIILLQKWPHIFHNFSWQTKINKKLKYQKQIGSNVKRTDNQQGNVKFIGPTGHGTNPNDDMIGVELAVARSTKSSALATEFESEYCKCKYGCGVLVHKKRSDLDDWEGGH